MKIKIKFILALFLMIATSIVYSQSVKDSLNFSHSRYRADIFRTSIEKRLNTYNLNTSFSYSTYFNKFFVGVDENYFSSLISTNEKSIKDEQAISIIGEYVFSPVLKLGVLTQNRIYSNDKKIAINEASNVYTTVFSKIYPINQLQLVPYGGYSINKQVNEDDRGLVYGANIDLNKLYLSEFLFSSKIKFHSEDIAPRKNFHQIADFSIRNDLDLSITNILTGNYSKTRKDFYFDSDSLTSVMFDINKNIQSRIEKKYFIEERIYNSRFTSDIFFDLSAKVFLREIDRNTKFKNLSNISLSTFDTKIEEFRLDFSGITEYRSRHFFGKIKINYSEREERHTAKNIEIANKIIFDQRTEQEKNKNNSSEYTTISALGSVPISSKDNISFSILHRKLIFDTPSEKNFDDRDELLSIMRLSYLREFNHLFSFFINLEGSYNHIVYISSKRSSNNNIRRILKLSSGGEFNSPQLYSKNTFSVIANYTSYDFEDITPNSRSFSFRQFSAKDTTSMKIIGNINIDFKGQVKLSEQGDFVWSNFSNNPDRLLVEYYLEPILNIKTATTKIGLGIRYFSLQTFRYNQNNIKYTDKSYSSIGPIANFSIAINNVNMYFYGWYEFISSQNNRKRELANLTLSVNWNL